MQVYYVGTKFSWLAMMIRVVVVVLFLKRCDHHFSWIFQAKQTLEEEKNTLSTNVKWAHYYELL